MEDLSGNFVFTYIIQHGFIWRPSDSTVSEDDGIEPWTVTLAYTACITASGS
jgi:hypothetical protein